MKWFVLLCFCCTLMACSRKDVLIENHPLLGQKLQAPDYIFAVTNLDDNYSGSQKFQKINAHLMGIDEAIHLGYSIESKNTFVKEIFPQGETSLVIKEVYFIKPGFPDSLFTSGTHFAIVEDEKHQQYTVSVFDKRPFLELNKCEFDRSCSNRRLHLNTIFQNKQKKHSLFIDYLPKEEKKQSIEESNKEFANFLNSKNITVSEDLKYRPSLVVEVDYLQYGNLILYSPLFNVQNVSIYYK